VPLDKLEIDDLTVPDLVFQMGIIPNRIDLLTSVSGVDFEDAWKHDVRVTVSGLSLPVLSRADLIRNKRAAGRMRDLADIEDLERQDPDQTAPSAAAPR
jgi:hypothetical protein